MSKSLTIGNTAPDGTSLEATFLPETGLNMTSYKKGDVEVIDQGTANLFEERFAGLGPLIGPHFHRRNPAIIPLLEEEKLFPHIKRVRSHGAHDPFSHGVARYAPWQVEHTKNSLKGRLSGKDEWHGVPLAKLQGQNFKMDFVAEMTPKGLQIALSVVSDTDSLVGIHYYYSLGKGKAQRT